MMTFLLGAYTGAMLAVAAMLIASAIIGRKRKSEAEAQLKRMLEAVESARAAHVTRGDCTCPMCTAARASKKGGWLN